MRKKMFVWLIILGWILFVFAGYLSISRAIGSGSEPSIQCYPGLCIFQGSLEAELVGFAASALLTVAWIGILVIQARQRQWPWFVLTIIFGYICMSIYLIAVPEAPSSKEVGYWQAPPEQQSPRLKKKTFVILFILSVALLVIAVGDFFILYNVPGALQCSSNCTSTDAQLWRNPGFVAIVIVLVASAFTSIVLSFVVCVGSLVKQILQRQWVWFACTLIFGFIPILSRLYILIYLIFAPEMSQSVSPKYQPSPSYPPYSPVLPYQPVASYPPVPPYPPYSPMGHSPSEERW